jgi:predicted dehydrogenase
LFLDGLADIGRVAGPVVRLAIGGARGRATHRRSRAAIQGPQMSMKTPLSGVTGDLLAHCIDTAMWLNGPIDTVTAMTETFVKERTHNPHSKRPATRAATRRSTRSKSTARTHRSHGTCTICIA